MWNVWRTVLEENEKLARARLAAVEVFQQNVIEDAKTLRSHKLQVARKVGVLLQSPRRRHLSVFEQPGAMLSLSVADCRPFGGCTKRITNNSSRSG